MNDYCDGKLPEQGLFEACSDGNLENVKVYLNQGADSNYKENSFTLTLYEFKDDDDDDNDFIQAKNPSCLHIASYYGHLSIVIELLNHEDINITIIDEDGLSPLLYAVIADHHEVSDYLRTKGATLNNNDKNMILFKACGENDVDTVKTHLDQGADPNWIVKIYEDDYTCLMFACDKGHHEVVDILIKNGAGIDTKDEYGWTPLMRACDKGNHEAVNILINNGAIINAKNKNGWTPLMRACDNGNLEVVDTLINNGADVNAKDKYGWTPLKGAFDNGHHEVVDVLINNGADINAKDKYGWTPLMRACDKGHLEVVDILINNGADINAKDKDGDTAISILESNHFMSEDEKKQYLDLLRNSFHLKDVQSCFHHDGTVSKQPDISNTNQTKSEQSPDDDPYFIKAISEGSGTLKPAVVVMHGPPGSGKTSVKQLLLGRPPLSQLDQQSTGVFERPIRTCRIKSHGGIDTISEVNREEFLQLLANNVKSRSGTLKAKSFAIKRPVQRPPESHSSPDNHPFINPYTSTMDVHQLEEHTLPPPSPRTPPVKLSRVMRDIHNRLSGSRSSRSGLFDLDWIYLVDSGGQPQFADILPALFQSEEALYIVVIRLDQGLDELHNNQYCVNGVVYQLPETLELTNRQLIVRACQIAEAQSEESSQKRVMIVGTCLDLIPNPDTCVDSLDRELLGILEEYRKVVVPKDALRGKVVFAVNAMSTGQERVKYINELQQCLIKVVERSIKPVEVPIKWFVYELDLEEESKSSHGIVRKDKCMELGRASGLSPKEIEQSLKFFNRIAVHLYHPDIDDMVLIKMDPLTDRMSALIKTSFMPPAFNPINDSDRLKHNGLMYKSYLQVAFEDIKDDNCITDDAFLKITEYLNVIVPIGLNEYFIPSALSVNSDCNLQPHYTPCLFSWHDRIIPPGFFFIVIVVLLLKVDEHSAPLFFLATQQGHQSRDRISLSSRGYGGLVTFFNHQKYVCIYYTGGRHLNDYINVLKLVVEVISNVIKRKFRNVMKFPSISFFCSICDIKGVFHPCLVNKDCDYCICPLDVTKMEPLNDQMVTILCSLQDNVQKVSYSISQHDNSSVEQPTSSDNCHTHGATSTTGLLGGNGLSSDKTTSLTCYHSHTDVLQECMGDLIRTIGDPCMLANDMFSKGLVSFEVKMNVSTLGLTDRAKVDHLLNHFYSSLSVGSSSISETKLLMTKFCAVLRNQCTDTLECIISKLEEDL